MGKLLRYASPQIANPHIFMINAQIANLLISTKCCTSLSQKSPKSRLFTRFLLSTNFNWSFTVYAILVEEEGLYLRTCGSFMSANRKKIGSANRKSANGHICGRSANLTNYLCLQICGFVICGTFMRIAQLCSLDKLANTT
jgi:hypothetical protein